jgi:hypothetical protein
MSDLPRTASPQAAQFPVSTRRRRFLLGLGAGTAGAAAAAAAPAVGAAVAVATPAAAPATGGYRLTEHISDYYATTRL